MVLFYYINHCSYSQSIRADIVATLCYKTALFHIKLRNMTLPDLLVTFHDRSMIDLVINVPLFVKNSGCELVITYIWSASEVFVTKSVVFTKENCVYCHQSWLFVDTRVPSDKKTLCLTSNIVSICQASRV